jgi:FtsP/CotA-like multicopper oxidase with cupredoxin domain
MRRLSFDDVLRAGRLFSLLTIGALAVLPALECSSAAWAQTAERRADPAIRPEFREPVTLTSKEGVLEVRLTARQGQATLDTAAAPVQNFLLFDYEVIRGTASDGRRSGGDLYPAPTLQVFPGERLIVHLENGLTGLTIRDYFIPQYTPKGQSVPIYPEQMTSSPINLHTHGAHISPKGNADNVLLHIPPGMSNTYTYDIPRNMPQGAYWYHSHLHGLTTAHVYTVSSACLRSDERTATCRWSPRRTFPSATWRFSITSSLTVPAAWRNSTIRAGRNGSPR